MSSVNLFRIANLNFRLLFIDKATIILTIILFIFSFCFSFIFLAIKTNGDFITYYNYYFLFLTGAFWIILSMRLVFLFLYSKIEDKTAYIIAMQKISRQKIIVSQLLTMFIYLMIVSIINFVIVNIFSLLFTFEANLIVLKVTFVHLLYLILISIFLIIFFSLISLIFKNQISTIIITLLLALTFIGNLPYQFLTTSEKSKNILFTNQISTAPIYVRVNEVYQAFDLQNNIEKGIIKYPNLSKYINNFFVENKFSKDSISTSNSQLLRKNFWSSLGLIDNTKKDYSFNLQILRLPTSWSQEETGIAVQDKVKLNFTMNYKFVDIEYLQDLTKYESDEENKNILEDLLNFQKDLFSKFDNGSFDIQKNYAKFFGELIEIDNGSMFNENSNQEEGGKQYSYGISDLISSYQSYFSSSSSISSIVFQNDGGTNTDIKKLFEEVLYNPLYITARVLEQYFINYTSNYVQYTNNYYINTSYPEWQEYIKSRNLFLYTYMLNPIANLFSVFTYYSGVSSEDIWFDYTQNSSIELHNQENMFLGYSTYNFKLVNQGGVLKIDPQSYNNYLKPWLFLILQFILALLFLTFIIWVYSRKDIV